MRSLIVIVCCLIGFISTACSVGGGTSPIEARALKNPVPSTAQSIASGRKVYGKYCANCHGEKGDGNGEKAATLQAAGQPKPSDLTDDKWDHGSTDGEIFVNIRDGVGTQGAMNGLNGRPGVSDTDMWNMVNYIHTLKH